MQPTEQDQTKADALAEAVHQAHIKQRFWLWLAGKLRTEAPMMSPEQSCYALEAAEALEQVAS